MGSNLDQVSSTRCFRALMTSLQPTPKGRLRVVKPLRFSANCSYRAGFLSKAAWFLLIVWTLEPWRGIGGIKILMLARSAMSDRTKFSALIQDVLQNQIKSPQYLSRGTWWARKSSVAALSSLIVRILPVTRRRLQHNQASINHKKAHACLHHQRGLDPIQYKLVLLTWHR